MSAVLPGFDSAMLQQARTQAAPPRTSLHMSHFTAFLGTSFDLGLGSMPGSGPMPKADRDSSFRLLAATAPFRR